MKLVFLGTPAAAVPTLEALIRSPHEVALVVTRADRPAGRSARLVPPPVKLAAERAGLAVVQPTRVRTAEFGEALAAAGPELLVVVAYGRILPEAVLAVAPRGAVNVHFSLLPELRGAAPVQWALARGLARTGVTTMQMNEALDEGEILLQRETAVRPGEHAPELEARLAAIGAELLLETIDGLAGSTLWRRPQDPARATYAPLLDKRDGEIAPAALSAAEIEGRVRGFDPWPGVWVGRCGTRLRIREARATGAATSFHAAGEVTTLDAGGVGLVCRGGSLLRILRVQPEGGRPITAEEAIRGRRLAWGDRLEALGTA